MSSVFISYRREDSAGYAGRLCDRLNQSLGQGRVFMDVEDIAPGQDFIDAIDRRIATCDAMVVVIGPHWLEMLRARSQGGEDFVSHEIATALARGITVIPALVGGAVMPPIGELPAALAPLSRREALEFYEDRFDEGVADLLKVIRHLRSDPIELKGVWVAEMHKPDQPDYRIRLNLDTFGHKLIGTVLYPTGQGVIREGRLEDAKLAFSTTHVPQFSSQPATIQFDGELVEGEIRLVSVDDNGVASGVARKAIR